MGDHWRVDGVGMRGNCSVPMIFNGVVPEANLVGIELEDHVSPYDQIHGPCQILTYGAAYLGSRRERSNSRARKAQAFPQWRTPAR